MRRTARRSLGIGVLLAGVLVSAGAAVSSILPNPLSQPASLEGTSSPTGVTWLSVNSSGLIVVGGSSAPPAGKNPSSPTVLGTRAATWALGTAVAGELAERIAVYLNGAPTSTEFSVTVGIAGTPTLQATAYFETNATAALVSLTLVVPLGPATAFYQITAVTLIANVCPSLGVCP